ncbi:PqqD family protein [Bradyrhizobium sp. B124]|uniref:PqqD family protein n=1 Tax=Bradyrhizobium sp. B124 TaxID=3140245 RepID=UPI003183FEB8
MKSCVVFRPDPPKLFMLNLNAWFILELCDGRTTEQLTEGYCNQVASQMSEVDARENLENGLQKLREQGLIEFSDQKH